MSDDKIEITLRIKVDKEKLLGKIATATKIEDELREVLTEIRRMIVLEEETQ